MVRNNGTRYHKGLDIKSFVKDKKNIPADDVRAFSSGTVVYINTNTSSSNFGKYIVIDHGLFLTLYAHLSEIYVTLGKVVVAADKIGKIGTTSNTAKIPNSRAHVHFEIDFLCGNELDFGDWYTKNYGSKDKNLHGKYNGLNLFGVDTIKVATNLAKNCGFAHLFDDEPTAVTMFIKTNTIPDFVKKYQSIVCNNFNINNKILGWKIEWTWYGFPKKWEPIYNLTAEEKNITTKIISYSSSLLDIAKRRGTLSNVNNVIKLGSVINDALTKMGMK
jgi:murein DD-endopeptidase MepM/ murein hydrolase activator NlpD